MTSFVIPIIIVAVLVGLAFAIGGPVLAILLALAGVIAVGWFVVMGLARRTPADVARRADKQELLGPGGPDDPNRR